MKDYLQPAATFALALAIASLPFTLAQNVEAQVDNYNGEPGWPLHVKIVEYSR